jgi:hypothetical protein
MNTYNPKEFTIQKYKEILAIAKIKFDFCTFDNFEFKEQFLIMRHDIDFSLEHALIIAKIEKSLDIQSTFFIHLHNDFYNALDHSSLLIMKEILNLGHHIGLHFDVHYYQINSVEGLIDWLMFEKKLLETILNIQVTLFSFHNTNDFTMTLDEHIYAGMINTYSNYFKSNVTYCSDSNGYWRHKKLDDVLVDEKATKLQVLLHPEWWTIDEFLPREKIIQYINKRKELNLSRYDEALTYFGRINVGK